MDARSPTLPDDERAEARRRRIHELLDAGHGTCVLGLEACARVARDSLRGDGSRDRLLAWVVMPDHLHVLIEQPPDWPLARVVQGWKRHTTREIHRILPGSGQLWQRGYGIGSSGMNGTSCRGWTTSMPTR